MDEHTNTSSSDGDSDFSKDFGPEDEEGDWEDVDGLNL